MSRITKMTEWIKEHGDDQFEWGTNDCCMFVGKFIKYMVDKDPSEPYQGRYTTQRGAIKALKKLGSITEAIDKHLSRVEVAYLQRGDIVLFRQDDLGDTLGIKWSNGVYCVGYDGCHIVQVPTTEIITAWRLE